VALVVREEAVQLPRSILNSDLSLEFRQTTSSGKSIGSRSLVGVASPASCRRRRSLQIALRGGSLTVAQEKNAIREEEVVVARSSGIPMLSSSRNGSG
jgi:hypothetical protein